MKWWLTATAEWSLAHLPGGALLHDRLRARCGELAHLERSSRFDNALWFLQTVRRWSGELGDLRVVELGTGWVPAVPLAFMLSGARVDTYDVSRLVRTEHALRTLRELRRRADEFAAAAGITADAWLRRLSSAEAAPDFAAACRAVHGSYRAPFNTLQLPYADGEADLVVSNLVLQCVPAGVLRPLLKESLRVLRPGGFAVHRIRLTDEYARTDPRRNHREYLKYTQRHWNRWFCHRLKHLNRWRASQFLALFDDLGFACRAVDRGVDEDSIEFLKSLPLAEEFRGLPLDDLATIYIDIVLQRPAPAARRAANGAVLLAGNDDGGMQTS